jgi:hypothetical protein
MSGQPSRQAWPVLFGAGAPSPRCGFNQIRGRSHHGTSNHFL